MSKTDESEVEMVKWPQVVAYPGGAGGLGAWVDVSTGDGPECITRYFAAAPQPAPAPVAIDYGALIAAAWSQHRYAQGSGACIAFKHGAEWQAAQPAPARVPPEDWSVFNDSACVADGLSYAEALDYLTPERLQRGWSAVCVANRDNIVDAATGVQQEPKP